MARSDSTVETFDVSDPTESANMFNLDSPASFEKFLKRHCMCNDTPWPMTTMRSEQDSLRRFIIPFVREPIGPQLGP